MNKNVLSLFFLLSICFYDQAQSVTRDYLEKTLTEKGIVQNNNVLSLLYSLEEAELAQICPETLEKIIVFLRPLSEFLALDTPLVEQTRYKLFEFFHHLMPKELIFLILKSVPLVKCQFCGQLVRQIFEDVAQKIVGNVDYFEIRPSAGNYNDVSKFNFEGANQLFNESINHRLKAIFELTQDPEMICQLDVFIKMAKKECIEALTTKRTCGIGFDHFTFGKLWFFTKLEHSLSEYKFRIPEALLCALLTHSSRIRTTTEEPTGVFPTVTGLDPVNPFFDQKDDGEK